MVVCEENCRVCSGEHCEICTSVRECLHDSISRHGWDNLEIKGGDLMRDDYVMTLLCAYSKRYEQISKFHHEYRDFILKAPGSSHKHQAWEGGYIDHITECFMIARSMYTALKQIRGLPFDISSVFDVLYFHDIEKIFKYTDAKEKAFWYEGVPKQAYEALFTNYGIVVSWDEANALKFIHGEPDHLYNKDIRILGELGAFCHSCDILSARMWYNYPKPEEQKPTHPQILDCGTIAGC